MTNRLLQCLTVLHSDLGKIIELLKQEQEDTLVERIGRNQGGESTQDEQSIQDNQEQTLTSPSGKLKVGDRVYIVTKGKHSKAHREDKRNRKGTIIGFTDRFVSITTDNNFDI